MIEQHENNDKQRGAIVLIEDLYRAINAFKLYFCIPLILSTLLALIYALIATPTYRAEVTMNSAQEEGDSLGRLAGGYSQLANLAGFSLPQSSEDKTQTALAILKSRIFIEAFVKQRGIRPILFESQWNQEKLTWFDDQEPSPWQTYQIIMGNIIQVVIDRRTQLISFTVDWSDPELAAEWANSMIADLNSHVRNQTIEETQKSIYFLEQQLEITSQIGAQNVIYNLIEEQTKKIMLANVRTEYAFKIIDPAVVPEMKYKPSRTRIVIIGFVIGMTLGFILVLLRNYFTQNKISKSI
jgi:uncharacterized protein involved in exopolysaccharide biosynthesis